MSIHYIIARRATGRTQHAIDWLFQDIENRAIAVPSNEQRTRIINNILRKAVKEGYCQGGDLLYQHLLKGDYIIVAGYRKRGQRARQVYVDNLDQVLQDLFGDVRMANTTGTSELWHRESRHESESEG